MQGWVTDSWHYFSGTFPGDPSLCTVLLGKKNTGVALISTPRLTSPESFKESHFPVNISFPHCKSRLV